MLLCKIDWTNSGPWLWVWEPLSEACIPVELALAGRFIAAVNSLFAVTVQILLFCSPTLFGWRRCLCASLLKDDKRLRVTWNLCCLWRQSVDSFCVFFKNIGFFNWQKCPVLRQMFAWFYLASNSVLFIYEFIFGHVGHVKCNEVLLTVHCCWQNLCI